MIIEDWKKIHVSLGLVASVLSMVAAVYYYAESTYAHAADLQEHKKTLELRLLEKDKTEADREILKLEVKKQAYPQRFDAVDKALLERYKEEQKELKQQIQQIKAK